MLVEPDLAGGLALGEEEQVGLDGGVRLEHALGQPDDGVQVAFLEQLLLQARLAPAAEEEAVGQDQGAPSSRRQELQREEDEVVRRVARAQLRRKVSLCTFLLHASEGRIGQKDIHAPGPEPGDDFRPL